MENLRALEALEAVQKLRPWGTVLDVGAGPGRHSHWFKDHGYDVTPVDAHPGFPGCLEWRFPHCEPPRECSGQQYDIVWASHVLEHCTDPGGFLEACKERLVPGGLLAVTVPPRKDEIVGGHVTLWNAGLLLYNLVLAGFDCSQASVKTYGYNVSVIVPRPSWEDALVLLAAERTLTNDSGDIARLAEFFPLKVKDGFNGNIEEINWP